jgi:hypothetical protein
VLDGTPLCFKAPHMSFCSSHQVGFVEIPTNTFPKNILFLGIVSDKILQDMKNSSLGFIFLVDVFPFLGFDIATTWVGKTLMLGIDLASKKIIPSSTSHTCF